MIICKYCKKEYLPKKRGRPPQFCSKNCSDNYRIRNTEKKYKLNCQKCGEAFKSNSKSQKYCSVHCSSSVRKTGRTVHEKICLYCEEQFSTITKGQKYCCSTCASRDHADKIRGYKYCKHCGEEFYRDHLERYDYCSKECSLYHRFGTPEEREKSKQVKKATKLIKKVCLWCDQEFETNMPQKMCCSKNCSYEYQNKIKREQWANEYLPREFYCMECGEKVITQVGITNSVFCSERCSERNNKRKQNKKNRHSYNQVYKKRRKKQIQENFVEPVYYDHIYKRDGGVCQICGLMVHDHIDKNNTWGGTIDHIIPLSKGGKHHPDNCQLAHRICNSLKSDSMDKKVDWDILSQEENYWKYKLKEYHVVAEDMRIS